MASRNNNFVYDKPGSFEPGFFIEAVAPRSLFTGVTFPPGVSLRLVTEPASERFPSLFILPADNRYRSLFAGEIPVICYGPKDREQAIHRDGCHFVACPASPSDWEGRLLPLFSPRHYSFPGGFIAMKENCLACRGDLLTLTDSECALLRACLSRSDRYLSYGEIRRITGKKALRTLICRLRAKVNDFLSRRCSLVLDFRSVRSQGYYLGITVDNLWKTL